MVVSESLERIIQTNRESDEASLILHRHEDMKWQKFPFASWQGQNQKYRTEEQSLISVEYRRVCRDSLQKFMT